MLSFVGGVVATVGLGRLIDRDASSAIAFVDLHDEELGNRFLGRWTVDRNDTTDDQDAIVTSMHPATSQTTRTILTTPDGSATTEYSFL